MVVIVDGWTSAEDWWWRAGSSGSLLTVSNLTFGKSGCSDLAVGMV